MKTFLINLDKDKERYLAADGQLKKFGISYERFPAVYGKDLSQEEKKKYVSRVRTLMAHGLMWSPGQIGCTLSHLFLYKKMIDENIPCALIFEDDLKVSSDFTLALEAVEHFVDASKRQVILLSDHSDNVNQRLVEHTEKVEVIPINGDICSEAYVVTLPAAREIYRINFPMAVMVDAWMRYRKRGHIELYRVEPPLVRQNREDFATNLEMYTVGKGWFWKMAWKVWRLFGTICDQLYFLLSRR